MELIKLLQPAYISIEEVPGILQQRFTEAAADAADGESGQQEDDGDEEKEEEAAADDDAEGDEGLGLQDEATAAPGTSFIFRTFLLVVPALLSSGWQVSVRPAAMAFNSALLGMCSIGWCQH